MKRLYYVSRFARSLTKKDLENIRRTAERNNRATNITGFLVCLGDMFFQVLEGPEESVDHLFYEKLIHDRRHKDVHCLKSENKIARRLFPAWNMKIFDLNSRQEVLPFAFRQMFTALVESNYTISQYTQPSVFRLLESGINPTTVLPRRKTVTVLFSDIIGFSQFSEWLAPKDLINLVNSHIEICTQVVARYGGEVNKLTGDGVLAYFSQPESDTAIEASLDLLQQMKRLRARASANDPVKYLYEGIGLAYGPVYEGNIGFALKRDYTILGNTVNLAARLESHTRELEVRLIMEQKVVQKARQSWDFIPLGKHRFKGQSRPVEIRTLKNIQNMDVQRIYADIDTRFAKRKRRSIDD